MAMWICPNVPFLITSFLLTSKRWKKQIQSEQSCEQSDHEIKDSETITIYIICTLCINLLTSLSKINLISLFLSVHLSGSLLGLHMCITVSPTSRTCIVPSNGSLRLRKSVSVTTARAQVITAPKTSIISPAGLTKQGVLHTDLRVQEIVTRQSCWPNNLAKECNYRKPQFHPMFLDEAYNKCRNICEEYAKTFYLGPTSFPFSP